MESIPYWQDLQMQEINLVAVHKNKLIGAIQNYLIYKWAIHTRFLCSIILWIHLPKNSSFTKIICILETLWK